MFKSESRLLTPTTENRQKEIVTDRKMTYIYLAIQRKFLSEYLTEIGDHVHSRLDCTFCTE